MSRIVRERGSWPASRFRREAGGALSVVAARLTRSHDLLNHPTRRLLYDLVKRFPGTYTAELQDRTDLVRNTLRFHLDKLACADLVTAHRQGRRVYYFPSRQEILDLKQVFIAARDPTRVGVLREVHRNPNIPWTTLADRLDVTPRAVRWQVGQLQKGGLIRVRSEASSHTVELTELGECLLPSAGLGTKERKPLEEPAAKPRATIP